MSQAVMRRIYAYARVHTQKSVGGVPEVIFFCSPVLKVFSKRSLRACLGEIRSAVCFCGPGIRGSL